MLGLYLEPKENIVEEFDISNVLEVRDILQCGVLGYLPSAAAGLPILIVHDDNAWKKEGLWVSAINRDGTPILAGAIFVLGCDYNGDYSSLQPEQIARLRQEVFSYEKGKSQSGCCIRLSNA